jgi:hypothetical protein
MTNQNTGKLKLFLTSSLLLLLVMHSQILHNIPQIAYHIPAIIFISSLDLYIIIFPNFPFYKSFSACILFKKRFRT